MIPTMRTLRLSFVLSAVLPIAIHAQSRPPITSIGPVTATSTDSLATVSGVRALPGGRLLVNDPVRRQVLMLDSSLALIRVVADSTSSTANAYGPRPGSLVAYRGDSTLFIDPASLSMLVIDGNGTIARVMSVPRSQDATMLSTGAAYDGKSKLVYRGAPALAMNMASMGRMMTGGPGALPMPEIPDTLPVVRVDLVTRQLDTVSFVKIPKTNTQITRGEDGRISVSVEVNPLPVVDDWAVTSDGAVAVIRGRDYHVDWMAPDGSRKESPKIAFDWKRLTDDQKVGFIDSVRVMRERMEAANPSGTNAFGNAFSAVMGGATPPPAMGGGAGSQVMIRMDAGGGAAPPPRGGAPAGGMSMGGMQINPPVITYVPPSELPDYQPPFFSGSARADADGNVWVRTIPTKPTPGGAVYDIINRDGDVATRVQVPEGSTIVGFAPNGVVIMLRSSEGSVQLQRARLASN